MKLRTDINLLSAVSLNKGFDVSRELLSMIPGLCRSLDLLFLGISGFLAFKICAVPSSGGSWTEYNRYMIITTIIALFLFRKNQYLPIILTDFRESFALLLGATLRLFSITLIGGFLTHTTMIVSQEWTAVYCVLFLFFAGLQRALIAVFLRAATEAGLIVERLAIVGSGASTDNLIQHLRATRPGSIEIIGIYDDRSPARIPQESLKPTGSLRDLIELAKSAAVDKVYLTLPCFSGSRLSHVLHLLKSISVDVMLCPTFLDVPDLGEVDRIEHGVPLLHLVSRPLTGIRHLAKRLEDLILATALLAVLSPALLVIAFAIRVDSAGPVLFRQRRLGLNNAEIEVLKFRSMRWDQSDPGGRRQTSRGDERVTRVGAFIRRFSLDELPQLWNVLRGDMSLVGPRPHALEMTTEDRLCEEIVAEYAHRHRVKPGITGWAQVNGSRGATRNSDELRNRVELDLHYIENWSVWLDARIIVMTAFLVLRDDNAY